VPGYSNPQKLNRYSYVTNNPLLYTDPTGHMQVQDGPQSRGCSNPKYCNNGKPKSNEELAKMRNPKKDQKASDPWDAAWDSWATGSYPWSFPAASSWGDQGPIEIDNMEFEQMLKAVGDDLQGFPTLGWYDTPFYNVGGDLTGIGCVNGKCYDRSELNYIGEGEALAKMGFSRESTQNIVWAWKNKGAFVFGLVGLDSTPTKVSQGTIDMTDIGWIYYTQHYSGPP